MSKGYYLKNMFVSDAGNACYSIWVHGDGNGVEAVYRYASFAAANVCDMVDCTQSITAETWNELKRKLNEKHPTGWHWEVKED